MAETKRKLPGSLEINRQLSHWLTINKNGTVDMRPGKIEIGQGILTALTNTVRYRNSRFGLLLHRQEAGEKNKCPHLESNQEPAD